MARIKGIVMEHQNGNAVIMTPRGEFKRIKINKPIDIGEIYTEKFLTIIWKYAVAAVVILAISLGTIDFFSIKAYAQVLPSVKLGINRWNIVIATHALDANGEEILEQSRLIGQKVDVAVEQLVDQTLQNDGSLDEENLPDQVQVQSTGQGKKDEAFIQRVEENVKEGVEKSLDKRHTQFEKQDNDQGQDHAQGSRDQGQDHDAGQDHNQGQYHNQGKGQGQSGAGARQRR
jgi:hypothetical protein